jgi:hypothetical protein
MKNTVGPFYFPSGFSPSLFGNVDFHISSSSTDISCNLSTPSPAGQSDVAACSSCTNPGIDVGDLTQNMFYNSLCNTLCNMLCNMLCMLCNILCNIAYSRFASGAIKSSSTKGRVSSRIRIRSPVRCFPSCLLMYMS